MKSSDVEREIAQRNGATVVTEIPLGTRLSDRNAKKVFSGVTDYRATRIIQTEGAAESESRAYGRDAVLDKFDRRKKLQRALDQMMSDAGMSEAEAGPLRDALERELDEDDPEDEEESEDEEPAEGEPPATKWLHDALDQLLGMDRKRKAVVAKDRSVAMDACCAECAALDASDARRKKICFADCASQARWWKAAREARRQHAIVH
jgi:hypothetical protein